LTQLWAIQTTKKKHENSNPGWKQSLLREAWGIPFGLPATEWMLEIGAIPLQTETELILKSRRVVPGKLLATNFQFEFSSWDKAAQDLCRRWRAARS